MNPNDTSLERFVEAQDPVFAQVLNELAQGRKQTHWMWFVFPQFKGLGRSSVAEHFGIVSVDEAFQYLEHPVLGPRLEQCVRLVLEVPPGKSAYDIFGSLDYLKFKSSLTLFKHVAGGADTVFAKALDRFFAGQPDTATMNMMPQMGGTTTW